MKKTVEVQLYETWLNIKFADELNADMISDLEVQIKEFRAHKRKTGRLLLKAVSNYKELFNREPAVNK